MKSQESKTRQEKLEARVSAELAGLRLDQAMARLFSDFSRSRLQGWIKEGSVLLSGHVARIREKVSEDDLIELVATFDEQVDCQPENIPLDIRFEDEHLLVVNKQPGLVVHPAVGNWQGTLQNGLLFHNKQLAELPRAGIVHRLDKDTSGLMVIAKTQAVHKGLVAALQAREVKREYRALVNGRLTAGGTVDKPIGRHPKHRLKMAVNPNGKEAITHYRVLERYRQHSLLKVNLETGRTHQIRVHLAYVRHPILGDATYGGRPTLPPRSDDLLIQAIRGFKRQALHACRLGFRHPTTGEAVYWEAEMPDDMLHLISCLKDDHNEAFR